MNNSFMNDPAVILENEKIKAVVLPKRGGKLASLVAKETGMELLFQNPFGVFRDASFESDFSQYEACGFDDAFPNIDGEVLEFNGKRIEYPDHGEIWHSGMVVTGQTNKESAGFLSTGLFFHSERFGYDYEKNFILDGKEFTIHYRIINTGQEPFPCIFTMHCLVNITPEMRFVFPEGTDSVLNTFDSMLGKAGSVLEFPEAVTPGGRQRLDRIPESGMLKFYAASKISEGKCGYIYPETNTELIITFDKEKLPYLGLWITNGGYRGDKNAALEPSTGFYDSASRALRLTGDDPVLSPGEIMEFSIKMTAGKLKASH